ncbi:MAG TPA: DUF2164 domain-containing protein [Gemmatimonadaceae bacterium]
MRKDAMIAIPETARKQALASLKRYVSENLDQEIGDLKAELLLDYVLRELGPTIYNQAIADARDFFQERTADLDAVCYRKEFGYWPGSPRDA